MFDGALLRERAVEPTVECGAAARDGDGAAAEHLRCAARAPLALIRSAANLLLRIASLLHRRRTLPASGGKHGAQAPECSLPPTPATRVAPAQLTIDRRAGTFARDPDDLIADTTCGTGRFPGLRRHRNAASSGVGAFGDWRAGQDETANSYLIEITL